MSDVKDQDVLHTEMAEYSRKHPSEVLAGTIQEKSMTPLEALRAYPYAVMWSIFVSLAIIMEGYDVVLINGLIAQPAFQRKFGTYFGPEKGYQITGPWQVGLSNGTAVGTIFGAIANGYLTQRFGYRKTLLFALAWISGAIFITFFAQDLPMLLAGSILCGMPWGLFATMAPAYASEICPTALRGYLANYVCFAWAAGLLLSAGVLDVVATGTSQWAYRVPFAVQWAWPVPLFAIIFFAPESPWFLIRKGDRESAEKSFKRLLANNSTVDVNAAMSMMEHTIAIEEEANSGTSYLDCFRGTNLRRTEITCLTWVCQIVDGTVLTGSPTYFFVQAGLGSSIAFQMSVGAQGLACIGVIVSWFLIYWFGRRPLYIFAMCNSLVCLLGVGIASAISDSKASSFAQAGIVCVSIAIRFATVGPVCYAIISEISAVSLRSKTLSLARCSYYIFQILCNIISPYMINPTEGNWKGKAGFFWAGSCGIMVVWTWFRLPETKGRTFEEIDILFHNRIPARKFKATHIDVLEAEALEQAN
ncbi:sugar transporter [Aureobasidium sp. EXF-10728]|nr:sugar transporter [Aureobasidium sp. EXF-10728]